MKKIKATVILEIMGKPAEHIQTILNGIVENLGKEKDVKIINEKIAEPKELEGKKGIFTSFAEVELETGLEKLMLLLFAYMPSHVEIIEPENLQLRNADLNIFFNELMRKLHQYDEIAKTMLIERENLNKMIKDGKIRVESVIDVKGGKRVGKVAKKPIRKKAKKK